MKLFAHHPAYVVTGYRMDAPISAWAARPLCVVVHERRISATRTVREERAIFRDTTQIDRMHHAGQLSDRQHAAACRLYSLFVCAGLCPRITPRVDIVPEDAPDWEEIDGLPDLLDGETPAEAARRVYRAVLRDAGPVSGPILDDLMRGHHPGMRLPALHAALDTMARVWGIMESH